MVGADLILLNALLAANTALWSLPLLLRLGEKSYLKPSTRLNPGLRVSVLIPLFREKYESVMATARSIARQTYPRGLLEVVLVVEPDDYSARGYVMKVLEFLRRHGVSSRLVESDGRVKLKAHALNCALRTVRADVVAVYDADDVFPEDQVEKAAALIEEGYDVVCTRVHRFRNTTLGRFLLLETLIWYNIYLPLFYAIARFFPFSGEGLFLRRSVLDAVGGFPEVLAEDAYLSLLVREKGFRSALLDSEVEELAPKGWVSYVKQRLRWNKGYLQCLPRLFKSPLPVEEKLKLLVVYWAPVACGVSLVATAFLALDWTTWALTHQTMLIAPWAGAPGDWRTVYFWYALLAFTASVILTYAAVYAAAGKRFEPLAPYTIALPIYWALLGLISLLTPFAPSRRWLRTERR